MIRDVLVTTGIAAANGGGCAGFSSQTRGPSLFLARMELHVHTPGRGGSWQVAPPPPTAAGCTGRTCTHLQRLREPTALQSIGRAPPHTRNNKEVGRWGGARG